MSTIELDTRNAALVVYIGFMAYFLYCHIEVVQRDTRAIRNELDAYPTVGTTVDVDDDPDDPADEEIEADEPTNPDNEADQ